jgi:hypothetical protein
VHKEGLPLRILSGVRSNSNALGRRRTSYQQSLLRCSGSFYVGHVDTCLERKELTNSYLRLKSYSFSRHETHSIKTRIINNNINKANNNIEI